MKIVDEGRWTQEFLDDVYACIKTVCKSLPQLRPYFIDSEQARLLIQAWIDMHPDIEQCISHRCERHRHVGPLNASTVDGAECGACILLTARTSEQLLSQERRDHEAPKHHQVSEPAGQHLAKGDAGVARAVGEAD